MPKSSSAPRRSPASGPKTARQRELNTKRRGELSELAFVHKAASLGFGVAKPYGDSERFDFILVSRDWPQGDQLWRVQVKSTATLSQGFYHVNAHRRTLGLRNRLQTHRGRFPRSPHHPRRLLVHLPHRSPGHGNQPLIPPQKFPQKRTVRPIPRSLAPARTQVTTTYSRIKACITYKEGSPPFPRSVRKGGTPGTKPNGMKPN